jgi:hypothetical protein
MSLSVGYTCRHQAAKPAADKAGACIRVHELFKSCPEVGVFSNSTVANKGLFMFVTAPAAVNVAAKTMANVPKKHVGIYFDGLVWHYSNTKDKVVTATTEQFQKHYSSQTNGLYYGTFPAAAVAVSLI